MNQPKILFVAAELTPLAKTGGLADVVGALPIALRNLGFDVRVIIPRYSMIDAPKLGFRRTGGLTVTVSEGVVPVGCWVGSLPGTEVPVYLLENNEFLSRGSIYFEQTAEEKTFIEFRRFLFFDQAVVEFLKRSDWQPDILHGHDWEAALLPLMTDRRYRSVLTVHNLAIQGVWRSDEISRFLLRTPADFPAPTSLPDSDDLNLLGLGIETSDAVTTVSPNYAQEILTPAFGRALEGLLAAHRDKLRGILNGIDTDRFDPATDPAIHHYDRQHLGEKSANRRLLYREFSLTGRGPVFGFIGRLTDQKGIDLVVEAADWFAEHDASLVVLGKGLTPYERQAVSLKSRLPDRAAVVIGFDAALAQRIYAGSDFFLMPSRFEPCGLGQMIALRYGTPPIVRAVGGLKDTVRDLKERGGTGVVFNHFTQEALTAALDRALALFAQPAQYRRVQDQGMRQDFSWAASARQYTELYQDVLRGRSPA